MQQACARRSLSCHVGRHWGDALARTAAAASPLPTAAQSVVSCYHSHFTPHVRQETCSHLSRHRSSWLSASPHPSHLNTVYNYQLSTSRTVVATRLPAMTSAASTSLSTADVTHLTQQEAIAVDEELFSSLGFSVDQLMVSDAAIGIADSRFKKGAQ